MSALASSSVFASGKLPEGRAGRLTALGVTFVGLLLVWFFFSSVLGIFSELKNGVSDKEILLARTQALVASIPRLQERAEEAARNADGNDVLIGEDSEATAQARLQEIVQGVAQPLQVELSSQEPLPLVRRGTFQRLALRVSFSTSWPVFVNFLYGVTGIQSPHLLIDDLQIQSAGNTRLADEASKGRPVDVSITLVALRHATSTPVATHPSVP